MFLTEWMTGPNLLWEPQGDFVFSLYPMLSPLQKSSGTVLGSLTTDVNADAVSCLLSNPLVTSLFACWINLILFYFSNPLTIYLNLSQDSFFSNTYILLLPIFNTGA